MVAGGLPAGNLLVVKSRFGVYTYPSGGAVTFALIWALMDDENKPFQQIYSITSDINKWRASAESAPGAGDEGRFAIPMAGQTGFGESSNTAFLMRELLTCGYPESVIREGDAMRFDNLYAMFEAKAQPKRSGGGMDPNQNRDSVIPVKIHNLPWEASKRGTLPGANGVVPTAPVPGAPPVAAAVAPPVAPAPTPAPPIATPPAAAPIPPAASPASAPTAPVPAPAASPAGGPDPATLQKVCLEAVNAVLVTTNPAPHASVGAHIMRTYATDPNVATYTSYLFGTEMMAALAAAGIQTANGVFAK